MAFPEDEAFGLPMGGDSGMGFQGPMQGGGGGGFMGLMGGPIGMGAQLGLAGLGNIAGGMRNRRAQQNAETMNQDQLRSDIDKTALAYAGFNRQDPRLRAHDAMQGDLLAGLQNVQAQGSGRDLHFGGGLNPGLISKGTRNYGQLMSAAATGEGPADPSLLDNPARQAMLAQLRGDYGPRQQQFTQPTKLKQAGLGEKIMSFFG